MLFRVTPSGEKRPKPDYYKSWYTVSFDGQSIISFDVLDIGLFIPGLITHKPEIVFLMLAGDVTLNREGQQCDVSDT